MNTEAWKAEFEGRKILIWGFGREGKSSLAWIRHLLPDLPLAVAEPASRLESLRQMNLENVTLIREEEINTDDYDLILKSPGIVFPKGMDRSKISQQSHLFLKHHRQQTIGITGTKGKSTTASLAAAVLSEQYRTHLVGNIGIPCFDILPELKEEDQVVFEISCHQLEYCPYSPRIGVYLNLYEEHLDHYESFQAYGDAKANVFRNQEEGDIAILHEDLPYAEEREDAYLIGRDIHAEGKTLFFKEHSVTAKHPKLIGAHNMTNAAIVYAIARLLDVSDASFLRALDEFQPLHHRLEKIAEKDGITYVNDSISTIGQASIAALNSLPETDVILIGGMDRGIDYKALEDCLASRKDLHVIFMYATGRRIHEEMKTAGQLHDNMHVCDDLEAAVKLAARLCRKGHIVLLSPAASSYDHFKNFEERGEVFGRLVEQL
ncbi:MAG: UDP-N-acetylmuramoyl-L-alanine--D-glutamate ligase [Solobacterium sp.]|nr:UDP-N-acetylmuramoyl-L-alanine--D-glutamate ligase [Solobacterium sp.]